MPPTLKNFGLESAVNDLFQKISGSGAINASCRFHDYRDRLIPQRELLIFRVTQELVNNILKHSHASFIHLTQNIAEENYTWSKITNSYHQLFLEVAKPTKL
jgi:signal transduction histidine kinase